MFFWILFCVRFSYNIGSFSVSEADYIEKKLNVASLQSKKMLSRKTNLCKTAVVESSVESLRAVDSERKNVQEELRGQGHFSW